MPPSPLPGEEFTLGASGILFFVATYAFTNLGAFVAVIAISQRINSDRIADYAGMWKRAPFLAAALAFCLISLTGIPPTAGFWAKLYIFNAGIRADVAWLVGIGVLNSVVSAYYYLAVVRQMFLGDLEEGEERRPALRFSPTIGVSLAVATAGVLVFGILPAPLIDAAQEAVQVFARGVAPWQEPYAIRRREPTVDAHGADLPALERIAADVMRGESLEAGTGLSVLVTSDDEMRRMNHEFLGIDEPTDVLSFPGEDEEGFPVEEGAAPYLGDIAIGIETAIRQAEEHDHPLDAELAHLLVHGILHLCGYDHVTGPEDEARMRAREEQYLGDLGAVHDHDHS
ncbi:MAG: rRNA maturation RNase YbeY [Dehalococcoidia bacterium]|nr:rRNA maturation RNase YbeY [Dehalococcoidia bacterium]